MENDYLMIYAVVPKYIYETKQLTPEEKLIAERIIALCRKEGYCWITNRKLSEMYNIRLETASRHIKKLEKMGLIKCEYEKDHQREKRIIYLVNDIWSKWSSDHESNNQENLDYSVKYNNKYNKKNNNEENLPEWIKHPEMCTSTPCTPEEQAEMDALLAEFK